MAILAGCMGCGGPARAAAPESGRAAPAERGTAEGPAPSRAAPLAGPARGGMTVEGELGEIDGAAAAAVFDGLGDRLGACVADGHGRVPVLAGDAAFFVRVGTDGRARYAYLEDSTLGDRDTEKCLVGVVARASWPRPKGGEAELRQTLHFDIDGGTRAPALWSTDKVTLAIVKSSAALEGCRPASKAKMRVTAYVEPDGRDGRVVAAGAAVAAKDGDGAADCVARVVRAMRLPSPGSYVAKVTFSF